MICCFLCFIYMVISNVNLSKSNFLRCNFRLSKREGLGFCWILFGMNHWQDRKLTNMQLNELEISILDGKYRSWSLRIKKSCCIDSIDVSWMPICRFLHPIVYGEYPKTMQNIVGNRLPKFSTEEKKMVTGSIDYLGINQYTTYYMYDTKPEDPDILGYQKDWHCGFACKS